MTEQEIRTAYGQHLVGTHDPAKNVFRFKNREKITDIHVPPGGIILTYQHGLKPPEEVYIPYLTHAS